MSGENTSAPWDSRVCHLLLPFANVSHSLSEISKAFRSSVKQLHQDFSGRPRLCLLLPLTRLLCSKALEGRSSYWCNSKTANRSRYRAMTDGRSVTFSGSLHTVKGVDDAGCGVRHTFEKVAFRYCIHTASAPSWWLGPRGRWHSDETRSILSPRGAESRRSCRSPPYWCHPSIQTDLFGYIAGLLPLSRGPLERGAVDA